MEFQQLCELYLPKVHVDRRGRMKKINGIYLIAILAIMGCSKPVKNQIKRDFYNKYVHAEILSIGSGEGDSDSAYYHIKYKHKDSNITKKAIFLYQYKDKKWRFVLDATNKSQLKSKNN